MSNGTEERSVSTSTIQARPTLYNGIQMRSRLEADYASCLDRGGIDWKYEPTCFAGPDGQWLPDFKTKPGGYIEVKPACRKKVPARVAPFARTARTEKVPAMLAPLTAQKRYQPGPRKGTKQNPLTCKNRNAG